MIDLDRASEDVRRRAASPLIVVAGAGGFIGGAFVHHLAHARSARIRAVDKKPVSEWCRRDPGAENLCLDLSSADACHRACEGAADVYNFAADMGGMGFIERFRIECMRSVLINTHLLEAAYECGAQRYFFASSACVYNTALQQQPAGRALKESDAYPAMAERGYGWEKLFSEMLCQEYWAERGLQTYIARFHNIYGPHGTWEGGREKAPAAICRKVAAAAASGDLRIRIWGDGRQTRSFTYIADCLEGIERLVANEGLVATPVNIGSSELVTIDDLVGKVERIAGVTLVREYEPAAPLGVRGRNSDNTFIRETLGWEPPTPLDRGLEPTYRWIRQQLLAPQHRDKVVA